MSIRALYNSRCNIETRSDVDDGLGGTIATWTIAYADVPCRIHVVPVGRRPLDAAMRFQYTHNIYLDEQDIDEQCDRITVGGRAYDIVSVIPGQNATGVEFMVAQCLEIR